MDETGVEQYSLCVCVCVCVCVCAQRLQTTRTDVDQMTCRRVDSGVVVPRPPQTTQHRPARVPADATRLSRDRRCCDVTARPTTAASGRGSLRAAVLRPAQCAGVRPQVVVAPRTSSFGRKAVGCQRQPLRCQARVGNEAARIPLPVEKTPRPNDAQHRVVGKEVSASAERRAGRQRIDCDGTPTVGREFRRATAARPRDTTRPEPEVESGACRKDGRRTDGTVDGSRSTSRSSRDSARTSATRYVCLSVCLCVCVCHDCEPCEIGCTDRSAVCGVAVRYIQGPLEPNPNPNTNADPNPNRNLRYDRLRL